MFQIGDIVMHPGYGICNIVGKLYSKNCESDIEKVEYVLKPKKTLPGNFRVLIPAEKIEECGLRYPIDKDEIPQLLQVLRKNPNDLFEDSRRGYFLTKERINCGDLYKIAEVIRDLEVQGSSAFSSRKEQLLEMARKIFIEEVSHVEGSSRGKVAKLIDNTLRKSERRI